MNLPLGILITLIALGVLLVFLATLLINDYKKKNISLPFDWDAFKIAAKNEDAPMMNKLGIRLLKNKHLGQDQAKFIGRSARDLVESKPEKKATLEKLFQTFEDKRTNWGIFHEDDY